MKIFITGAEGFIGSGMVHRLYLEHEVTAIDYLRDRHVSNIPENIRYVNHDLSLSFFPIDSKPPDLVMHFAVVSQEVISKNPELEQVNIKAMLNVLEFCRKNHVPLLFASSCSVYGPGTLHKTSDALNPKSLYAVGKLACEEYAKSYQNVFGTNVNILRYSNIYGDTTRIENKHYAGKKGVIRIFMEKALAGEPLPLIEGNQTRDFTFIDDVLDATCTFMECRGSNIVNIATGVETSIQDLALKVGDALGKKVTVHQVPKRKIDNIQRRSLDISETSNIWKPKYALKEGLKEFARRM